MTELERTLIFANLGRGDVSQATRSWASLAAHAAGADDVCPVEVDEGDRGYRDHQLLRRYFHARAWPATATKSREPILTAAGLAVVRSGRVRAGVSVHRQTPPRGITWRIRATLGAPDDELDSTHAAAGYLNGHRGRLVRAAIGVSYRFWRWRLRRRAHRAHRAGRHFTAVLDGNDPAMRAADVHPAAVELFRTPPDLGLAVAARGWRVEVVEHTTVPTFIEHKHQGHRVTYRFVKEHP